MDANLKKLQQLFGDEALSLVVQKLERKLAKCPEATGFISIKNPSDATRDAIASLLGRPTKISGPLKIYLSKLEAIVVDCCAASSLLQGIGVYLGREPQHAKLEKDRVTEAWQTTWKSIAKVDELSPDLSQFLKQLCRTGGFRQTVKYLDQAPWTLNALALCLKLLPLTQPTPLPIFAQLTLGDSHALDRDRPTSKLLLRAIKVLWPSVDQSNSRATWSSVNIVQDELSSTVLVLNLSFEPNGLIGKIVSESSKAGEPLRLTFRQLRLHEPTFANSPATIYVCENPSVLAAAAERHGRNCQPLICVEGRPSHAAIKLLSCCLASGLELRYHGDFDASGLSIASFIVAKFGAKPWRMGADAYRTHAENSQLNFAGQVPDALWDTELYDAIVEIRKVVLEELVIEDLLSDLLL